MRARTRMRGFTLVEALVGVAILGIVMAGIVPVFMNYMRVNSQSDVKSGAVTAAVTVLDGLRQTPLAVWPTSGTVQTQSGGDRSYDVTVLYCTSSMTYCGPDTRQVEVVVRFRGKVYYSAETVYTTLNAAFN